MSEIICIECKYIGKPKLKKRGSLKLDITCWLLFPFGLPYSLWRMFAKRTPVCGHCGSVALVPVDSEAGGRLTKIIAGEITAQKPEPSKI